MGAPASRRAPRALSPWPGPARSPCRPRRSSASCAAAGGSPSSSPGARASSPSSPPGAAIDGGVTRARSRAGLLPPARLRGALLPPGLDGRRRGARRHRVSSRSRSSAGGAALPLESYALRRLARVARAWMCAWQARNLENPPPESSHASRAADPLTGCPEPARLRGALRGRARRGRAPRAPRCHSSSSTSTTSRRSTTRAGTPPATELLQVGRVGTLVRSTCARATSSAASAATSSPLLLHQDRAGATAIVRPPPARARPSVGGTRRGRRVPLRRHDRRRPAAGPPTPSSTTASATAPRTPPPRRASSAGPPRWPPRSTSGWRSPTSTPTPWPTTPPRSPARLGWSDAQVGLVRLAAMLHDVGKIRVPSTSCASRGR